MLTSGAWTEFWPKLKLFALVEELLRLVVVLFQNGEGVEKKIQKKILKFFRQQKIVSPPPPVNSN